MLANSNLLTSNIAPIVVVDSGAPADRDLLRRVRTFLSTSHRPGLRSLQVEAHGGVVRLRGNVRTFYEKQLSVQLTRRVAGVVRLIDEVIVNRPQIDRRQGVVTIELQADHSETSRRGAGVARNGHAAIPSSTI
jgi:osmotically-inducible protein OsmY